MKTVLTTSLTLITTLGMAFSAQAFQLVKSFVSHIDAAQEVTESDSTATGFSTLNLLGDGMGNYQIEYKITVTPPLDFTFIENPGSLAPVPIDNNNVTKIHLHGGAPRGENGVLPFDIRTIDPDTGLVTSATPDDDLVIDINGETHISGLLEEDEFTSSITYPTFQSLIDELLATPGGADTRLYWNIHTSGLPSGAIRGQVEATPEPGTLLGLVSILGLVGFNSQKKKS